MQAANDLVSRGAALAGLGERRATRWRMAPAPDPNIVACLGRELSLPEPVCRLLAVRGFHSADSARIFLRPKLDELHDASPMLGMDRAVDRLEHAARKREHVLVHGDYDVDGICSTTILTTVLRSLGARVTPFIPRRIEDGYDLGSAGVEMALSLNADVVVTCDCGTAASAAVARLREAGISVIVTDHHLPGGGTVPECVAVLNPRQSACPYPDKDLAAAGVAFKLALQLARRMGTSENPVYALLDLVALATIADVAPLRGENRILARLGLKMLRESRNHGLRALLRSSGLFDKPITAGRVGFILAPRLNAVGRLGRALRGVELLLSESEPEANTIARELEELNTKRQEIDRATLAQARALLRDVPGGDRYGIVLAHEQWHPGVVGIVASRIVEETGRPTILIAIAGGVGKGSGRSIPAFDLHGGLSECAQYLERFGGHRTAAGITIRADSIPEFALHFNEIARRRLTPDDFDAQLPIDIELELDGDIDAIEKVLRHFEPVGVGNPGPVFLSRGVRVLRAPRKLGESGLRFRVSSGEAELEMLAWGMQHRAAELARGLALDVVYRLERDEWHGANRVQGRLLDFRSC